MNLMTDEKSVQSACLLMLRLAGYPAWRQNTGAVPATYAGRSRYIRFNVPGWPDLYAVGPAGRAIHVECKRPGGKLSDAQVAMLRELRAAGAVAVMVDDPGTLAGVLDALKADPTTKFSIEGNIES